MSKVSRGYTIDIEIYPNFFCLSAIPLHFKTNQELLDKYIEADIIKDKSAKRIIAKQLGILTFVITPNCSTRKFVNFIMSCDLLLGANIENYDALLIDFILLRTNFGKKIIHKSNGLEYNTQDLLGELFDLNERIIENHESRWMNEDLKGFKTPYYICDVMSLHRLQANRISLKQVGVSLKWHRVQDLPIPPGTEITTKDQIREIIDYNRNDILLTDRLVKFSEEEINIRINAGIIYNVFSSYLLSSSRSKMAKILLSFFYSKATGLTYYQFKNLRTDRKVVKFKELICRAVKFETKELQDFLLRLSQIIISVGAKGRRGTLKEKLIFRGTGYTFGKGGLHSMDIPHRFFSNENYIYRDADVSSFYPNIVINLKVSPKHLITVCFIAIAKMLVTERITAKHLGEKYKADSLKIVINAGLFGLLGDEFSWLYDLNALYTVTLNGQLFLLMLIEQLELHNFHVVSANTDGIVTKLDPKREEEYYAICKKWQTDLGLELEFTDYEELDMLTVNDYLAIKAEHSYKNLAHRVKTKGDFLIKTDYISFIPKEETPTEENVESDETLGLEVGEDVVDKAFYAPVMAICIYEYLVNKVDIDETLHNHTDIYNFCMSIKTNSSFINQLHYVKNGKLIIEPIQKTIRYFVSKTGAAMVKEYKPGMARAGKRINMLKGKYVTLFNDFYYLPKFEDYNIDYTFYKRKIMEIINRIDGNVTKDIKLHGGSLFD